MAWISVHETVDGPKLRKLYKQLCCSKFEAVGILNFLWWWGLQNADRKGLVLYADEEDIARYLYGVGAGCRLAPEKIVQALLDSGFIDKINESLYLHDWEVWQKDWYKYQERLGKDAQRKREEREALTQKKKNNVSPQDNPVDSPPDSPEDCPKKEDETFDVSANNKPKAEEAKKEKPVRATYTNDFEKFYEVYPRKAEKARAASAYNARIKQGWRPEQLLMAAENYAAVCKRNRTEQKYIKHAATFLSANTPFADFIPKESEHTEVARDDAQPDMSNPFGKFMGD